MNNKNSSKNGKNRKIKKIMEFKINLTPKNVFLWIIAATILLFVFISARDVSKLFPDKSLSTLVSDVKAGQVKKIEVIGDKLLATYKDGKVYSSLKEGQDSFYKILIDASVDPKSVDIEIKDTSGGAIWINLISNILPLLLMVGFFLFLIRQARGAQDTLFSFGQSRAKLFSKDMPKITFADVAGVDEAKQELAEVVDFLKNPQKYRALGARTPKGLLLVGPSGTGKTLLAKALAGEANVPFFSMAGSEFMEMLVGVGASVTGDTPVVIKQGNETRLLPIGEFVNSYYQDEEKDRVIPVNGIRTLGYNRSETGFWGSKSQNSSKSVFGESSWQRVLGVYRHKVDAIYEIHYLGGVIRTTGDHSVFVRTHGRITSKKTDELKEGDVLVDIPMNVRRWDKAGRRTVHTIKAHKFSKFAPEIDLDVWNDDVNLQNKYDYVLRQKGQVFRYKLAEEIGVSQMTVSNWQRGVHLPQLLTKKLVKLSLPDRVAVTDELMKLMGYYVAEGRSNHGLHFVFGAAEFDLHKDCISLMKRIFSVDPFIFKTDDNAMRITYYSAHLGRFFERFCGTGSHNKHVPSLLWDLPRVYFLAFLEGYTKGDGYITKSSKFSATSVSKQLIRELAWLCSMHGMKVGIKHEIAPGGRVIKNKPLPQLESWTLIIGKTSNPFINKGEHPYQFKRAIVKKIVKKPFNGYVYDLCGVVNEAFFGGEKPVLLHNSRVRDLFNTAKKNSPAIIFIDEIDAIGRVRAMGVMGGHDEREQTLNQILVEMDGFTPNENVIICAATNRGDLLDPALLRPGRFDRRVVLDLPDMVGRKAILKIHIKGKPVDEAIDWDKVSKRTVGFSGADLENMLNEAAINAARQDRKKIIFEDIEEAATKVKLGPAKKRLQSDLDRKMTAYHEAGHAIVTHILTHMDPVHRISIVSRGMALGYTLIPPQKDRIHETKTHLLEQITSMLGGRAAEELVFAEMTSGASNDIDKATMVAKEMVVEFGMSDLGPINFGPTLDVTEWGGRYMSEAHISPDMQGKIDREIKGIIDKCYKQAQQILKKFQEKLDKVAAELIEKETLESEEFEKIMGPKPAFATVRS